MSDYSIFPKAIDGYAQLPLFVNDVTPVSAEGLNRIRSAIVNIENALGTLPQGAFDTVSLRLDDIDSEISTIESNIDAIEQVIFDLPNALFLDEATAPTAKANKGAIFISDGSGGLARNNLYYSNESGVVTDLLAGGGGDLETTLGLGNETGGNNVLLSSGDEIQGQTDVRLRSAADSNIDLISSGTGSVRFYTDAPGDNLVFLQMGELQETGLAHIPPGMFGSNGVLLMGFPNLTFPQSLSPGSTTVDVRLQSPSINTNAVGAGVGTGNVDIQSGSTGFVAPGTEGGSSGRVQITTGNALAVPGGPATPNSGEIVLRTGTSLMGSSGDVTIASGSISGPLGSGTSGNLNLGTGDAGSAAASTGNIVLEPGAVASPLGTRGFVKIKGDKLNIDNSTNNADITAGSASNAIIVGGLDNTASGASSFVGGGANNTASAAGASTSGGQWAVASHNNEHAHGSGRFAAAGDAQFSRMVLRRETSDATPSELSTSGSNSSTATECITINANTAYRFRIDAVAREQATGDTAWWEIKGCIKRRIIKSTTSLVGSQYVITDFDAGASSWQLLVTADDGSSSPHSTPSLKLQVVGEAAHTIRWVATVHLTKVSG
tara:strand:+ start:4598 stop:6415 length:1818 start_codon:yes stop_codon:yes gene_type:complete